MKLNLSAFTIRINKKKEFNFCIEHDGVFYVSFLTTERTQKLVQEGVLDLVPSVSGTGYLFELRRKKIKVSFMKNFKEVCSGLLPFLRS